MLSFIIGVNKEEGTMYEIPKDAKGGANQSYEPAGYVKGIITEHMDTVGLGAGEKVALCTPDPKGTDRGFTDVRDEMKGYNPQNQHEVINPEYTRKVMYGGQVKFNDEP